jgi:hypothetical protein
MSKSVGIPPTYSVHGVVISPPRNDFGRPNMRERIIAPRPVFTGDWTGADFRGANLEDAVFDQVVLRRADFHEAILNRTRFKEADLRDADFKKASLVLAEFTGANLVDASLYRADLTNADFFGANLAGTYLDNAILGNATGVRAFYGIAEWGPLYVFSEKWIKCGCRWFTLEEAKEHWMYQEHRTETYKLVGLIENAGWIKP